MKNWILPFVLRFLEDALWDNLDDLMDRGRARGLQIIQDRMIRKQSQIDAGQAGWLAPIEIAVMQRYLDTKMTDQEWQSFQDFLFGTGTALATGMIENA